MDHQEATRLRAVERYLLDELDPVQRAEFEEHFFGCQECATDLRITAEFLDIARGELKRETIEKTTPPQRRSWLALFWSPPLLAPALIVLFGIIAYQNLVVLPRFNGEIAQLKQPTVIAAISLIGANSRSATGGPVASAPAGRPFLLSLDIPAAEQYSSYVCVLLDSSGTVITRLPVSTAQAQDTVSINVPAGNLRPGDYLLLVQGVKSAGQSAGATPASDDIARYRFKLTPFN